MKNLEKKSRTTLSVDLLVLKIQASTLESLYLRLITIIYFLNVT